jgi:cytochrome c-type biogenesis protein CcmH
VSRRLLAAADAEAADPVASGSNTGARRAIAIAALVLLPLGSLSLYFALGAPSLPGQPLASRIAEGHKSIEGMVAQVEAHLAKNPKEGRGWEVIAPIYLRMGRYNDAVQARRNALALLGPSAERHAGLGEALTAAANGVVTAEAKVEFETAVKLDAEHVKARFFLGVAAEQDGRPEAAAAIWRALLASAPADAPWVEMVRNEIVRVTGGPTDQPMVPAADLSPEQRTAMIQGMVERLAERLKRDGSDLEGWLRLVRSYMVLKEREKALAALDAARRALAAEPDKLRRFDEAVKGLGLEG